MPARKKILSYFLLSIYLMVIGHQGIVHAHPNLSNNTHLNHQHEGYQEVHHEHQFHIGIFHFLGHLLEKISQSDDLADEHFYLAQINLVKKVLTYKIPISIFINGIEGIIIEVDANSLTDPPFLITFLPKYYQPDTPLRAPPLS